MAKMFVHIAQKASFTTELQTTYANSIVFIADTNEIFTHGKFYGLSAEYKGKIDSLQTAQNALKYFSKVSDGTNTASAQAKDSIIKFTGTNGVSVSVSTDGVSIDAPKVTDGTTNGCVTVTTKAGAVQVKVKGLGSAAYTNSSAYDAAGAASAAQSAAEETAAAALKVHTDKKDNPHGVTKAQVGLGNVENKTVAQILASAVLTGTPTAPTATAGTNTTQVATTAFVKDAVSTAIAGVANALRFKGTIASSGGTVTDLPATHAIGDVYIVQTAGSYAGQTCEVGDMIICTKAGTAAADVDWNVVQTNISGAVTAGATLTAEQLVVGSGNKAVKTLAAGTNGQVLKMVSGKPAWAADTDTNTTYTFANGTNGSFTVTPSGGSAQTVTIGKPSTAGTADKVANSLTVKLNSGSTEGTNMFTFNGSGAKSINITPALIGAAASSHSHTGAQIALTGYAIASSASAVAATDTVNTAIGKLELRLKTIEDQFGWEEIE